MENLEFPLVNFLDLRKNIDNSFDFTPNTSTILNLLNRSSLILISTSRINFSSRLINTMSTSRPKRPASSPPPPSKSSVPVVKKVKVTPIVDTDTPLDVLKRSLKAFKASVKPKYSEVELKEGCVVFWMR